MSALQKPYTHIHPFLPSKSGPRPTNHPTINPLEQQSCLGSAENASARVGQAALYAHVWPNLMLNRYGPWCDVNIVYPVSPSVRPPVHACLCAFFFFFFFFS